MGVAVVEVMAVPERIRHLFRRAGFGATPAEVARWRPLGVAAAVNRLLAVPDEPETIAPPFDAGRPVDLQANWLHRMVATNYPLAEKMTLFWHGHFATGIRKAGPLLMQQQNELLRRNALGSFPALLRAIGKNGAMLLWLDGHGSTRRAPNENYAREVMELFTTGPGLYTETDVAEAARAFTGWRVDRLTGAVEFLPRRFDNGEKRFLGRTGRFDADAIADILSALPETGRFLAGKLWRFFAASVPHEPTMTAMAEAYRQSGGLVKPMLAVLFTSDAFYDPAVTGSLVRSPVDLVATTLRLLDLPVRREAAMLCTQMGQSLFDPPNVAGWPGGSAWLGASSLLARWNFGEAVRLLMGNRFKGEGGTPEGLVDHWLERLCVPPVSGTTRQALVALVAQGGERDLVRAIVASPEYQTA